MDVSISLLMSTRTLGKDGKNTNIIFPCLPLVPIPTPPRSEGFSINTESQIIDFTIGDEYVPGHCCDFTDFSDPEKVDWDYKYNK